MNAPTPEPTPAFAPATDAPRLPRIALMGEFSAGKSTLANMMINSRPLPVQVVATQLPPVWISYGDAPPVTVDLEGNEAPCDVTRLEDIQPEDFACIRLQCEDEILKRCDLIDMPGISDPNMASAVWERIMPFADGVLWCSPATQAWRQSEAAVWDSIEDRVRENSLLVLTRADMLLTERDKSKVLKRVRAEAGGLFDDVLLISLAIAGDAGEDEAAWEQSGADAFVASFLKLLEQISSGLDTNRPETSDQMAVGGNTDSLAATPADTAEPSVAPRRPLLRRPQTQDILGPDETVPDPLSFMPKFS